MSKDRAHVAVTKTMRLTWRAVAAVRDLAQRLYRYHWERNHQGLANRLIFRNRATAANDGSIYQRRRLGGMLNFYYRGSA